MRNLLSQGQSRDKIKKDRLAVGLLIHTRKSGPNAKLTFADLLYHAKQDKIKSVSIRFDRLRVKIGGFFMPKLDNIDKARYWCAILYPESMIPNWQDKIAELLEIPFAYCLHDKDFDEAEDERKLHAHIILAFKNTTTKKHATNLLSRLALEGKSACADIQAVNNIRSKYEYLIHNTEDSIKKGKHQYDKSERILCNNFDIGSYEQLDTARKNEIYVELSNLIEEKGIYNYMDFYKEAKSYFDDGSYLEVMRCYGNHFNKLCDGNYQQLLQGRLKVIYGEEWEIENVLQNAPSQAREHEKEHEIICPDCGSEFVTKKGKTQAGSQRWKCKACQKIFV